MRLNVTRRFFRITLVYARCKINVPGHIIIFIKKIILYEQVHYHILNDIERSAFL